MSIPTDVQKYLGILFMGSGEALPWNLKVEVCRQREGVFWKGVAGLVGTLGLCARWGPAVANRHWEPLAVLE